MKYLKILFFIISIILITGCSTCMFVDFDRPPEIDLRGYSTIAMGDITDIHSSWVSNESLDIGEEIEQRLFEGKRFDVLDRQHIRALLEEKYLITKNQGMGGDVIHGLKDIIGAGAFIFGRIKKNEYNENTYKGDPYQDSKKKWHTTYYREGEYTYEIYLKVVDCLTAKVVATKNLRTEKTVKKSETDKWPEPIDTEELYNQCYKEVAKNFMKVIQPYKVQKQICFESDSDVLEIEKALELFENGKLVSGIEILKYGMQNKDLYPESRAKLYYNAGLAQLALDNYYESIENFKVAIMLVPEESKYREALSNAEYERNQYIKVNEIMKNR